jgi:hypothetical protein
LFGAIEAAAAATPRMHFKQLNKGAAALVRQQGKNAFG